MEQPLTRKVLFEKSFYDILLQAKRDINNPNYPTMLFWLETIKAQSFKIKDCGYDADNEIYWVEEQKESQQKPK